MKIGTEEQRRLNRVREDRIREIDQKFELLKLEVNVNMETVSTCVNRLSPANVASKHIEIFIFFFVSTFGFFARFSSLP